MLPFSHSLCTGGPLLVLRHRSNWVTELLQNLQWSPSAYQGRSHSLGLGLACSILEGLAHGISLVLPVTCWPEQATLLFPGPSSCASVSSVFPLFKTHISVHHSLTLLPHKTDLTYLPGPEDFLHFPCPSNPPFNM